MKKPLSMASFLFTMMIWSSISGDSTEKIWAHRFWAKPKTIAAGGLGGAVSSPGDPGRCLGEGVGVKPQNNFVFFSRVKHAKAVIVNHGCMVEVSSCSLVTLNNLIFTFSTIISLSLQNR